MRIGQTRAGFTLIEIMIVVSLVGLLATIAAPTWVRARTQSQTQVCLNNLRQVDGAKQQWALENKVAPTITPSYMDISSFLKSSVLCPGDNQMTFATSYNMHAVSEKPTCQIVPSTHFLSETTN